MPYLSGVVLCPWALERLPPSNHRRLIGIADMLPVGHEVQSPPNSLCIQTQSLFGKRRPPVRIGRSMMTSLKSRLPRYDSSARDAHLLLRLLLRVLQFLRGVFAVTIDLRVDEAYYWTWSKEARDLLSRPPAVDRLVYPLRNAVVRRHQFRACDFPAFSQCFSCKLLLADIVWENAARRSLRRYRATICRRASLDYGLSMAKLAPDVVLIPLELAMIWSLVRLSQSGNQRWWLAAGVFWRSCVADKNIPRSCCFLRSLPSRLFPNWRKRQLSKVRNRGSLRGLAFLIFSPVLYWNAVHDGASFRFQLGSAGARSPAGRQDSWADFVGQQFVLVGVLLLPIVLIANVDVGRPRGYRSRAPPVDPAFDRCDLSAWIFSSGTGFPRASATAGRCSCGRSPSPVPQSNLKQMAARSAGFRSWRGSPPAIMGVAIFSGLAFVTATQLYYIDGTANYLQNDDPIGKEAGFRRRRRGRRT